MTPPSGPKASPNPPPVAASQTPGAGPKPDPLKQFEMEYREAKGAAQHGTEKEVLNHIGWMEKYGKEAALTQDAVDVAVKEVWQVYYQRAVQEARREVLNPVSEIPSTLFGQAKYRRTIALLANIALDEFDQDEAQIQEKRSEGKLLRMERSAEQFVKAVGAKDVEGAVRSAENALAWGAAWLGSFW